MARRFRVVAASVLLLSVLSCSKKVTNLEVDPDFTANDLARDQLALGGVVSILEETTDPLLLSNQQASALQHTLGSTRKDLDVRPWGEFRQGAGDSTTLLCLTGFRDHGSLDKALLDTLAARIGPRPRFLAMARIEQDFTERKESKETEAKGGDLVEVGTKYTTRRTTVVSFAVYDLSRHRRAWAATIDGVQENSHVEKNGAPPPNKTVLDKTLKVLDALASDEDRYPEAPAFEAALEDAFHRFAKKLPKAK
jgi:hypothetical protein